MASVRTHLWFGNNRAVEAATFYAEHVPNSAVTRVFTARTEPSSPLAEIVEFTVAGHEVIGLNAGPEFHLDEAFSFYLRVDGQDEVDQLGDPHRRRRGTRSLWLVQGQVRRLVASHPP